MLSAGICMAVRPPYMGPGHRKLMIVVATKYEQQYDALDDN